MPAANPALVLLAVLATAIAACGLQIDGATAAEARASVSGCDSRVMTLRKSTLGIHQWTAAQRVSWCYTGSRGNRRVVSVQRRPWPQTGTNWRLVSMDGEASPLSGGRYVVRSWFHFRLSYAPYLIQNCRPRLTLILRPSGHPSEHVRVGC